MPISERPLTDDDWPDEEDTRADDDVTELVQCTFCGEMLAEESPQCPHCRNWGPTDSTGELGRGPRRWAWVVAALLLILVILLSWRGPF